MSKIVVITGVSQGLGRAMSKKFVQLGHTVIGCSRNQQAMQELQAELGQPHHFTAVDVTDEASVKAWSQQVLANYRAPDLLINNAGFTHRPNPVWEISSQEFNSTIDVNIKGVANVIRHFVPAMVEQKHGVIVSISSGLGRYTKPNYGAYAASKWAIEGLTRTLAQDLPDGMAAVPLWPGAIRTEALEIFYGKQQAQNYITAEQWAEFGVPYILQIGPGDNGKPLATPTG